MEINLMTTQTEKVLTTSWNVVRDAGSAVSDAAVHSRVGTSLAKNLPHLGEMVGIGAGLALARRGGKAAVSAIRRNPMAAIAGAVALAGIGVAIAVVRQRRKARENGDSAHPRTSRQLAAKNMRGDGAKRVAKNASKVTSRTRKTKDSTVTH
jgi:hypothetical protein